MKSSKLLISLLSVGLLFSVLIILSFTLSRGGTTNQDKSKAITIVSEKQVGKEGVSTKFSYFNTSGGFSCDRRSIHLQPEWFSGHAASLFHPSYGL